MAANKVIRHIGEAWKHAKALSQPQLSYSVLNTKMPFGITQQTAEQQDKTCHKNRQASKAGRDVFATKISELREQKGNKPAPGMHQEQKTVILIQRHGSLNTKCGVKPVRD